MKNTFYTWKERFGRLVPEIGSFDVAVHVLKKIVETMPEATKLLIDEESAANSNGLRRSA